MKHVSIPLSASQETFVDEQVASGRYTSIGEFLAELIDAKAKAEAQKRLEAMLLEGLEGEATEWTDADTERLERRAVNGR